MKVAANFSRNAVDSSLRLRNKIYSKSSCFSCCDRPFLPPATQRAELWTNCNRPLAKDSRIHCARLFIENSILEIVSFVSFFIVKVIFTRALWCHAFHPRPRVWPRGRERERGSCRFFRGPDDTFVKQQSTAASIHLQNSNHGEMCHGNKCICIQNLTLRGMIGHIYAKKNYMFQQTLCA